MSFLRRYKVGAVFLLLLGILTFLALNRHSKDKFNNYHSVLWADASGYYVYLPLAFTDYFEQLTPEDTLALLSTTGRGFEVANDRVFTKYPYGTSLMQAPFFLTAKLVSADPYPFSKPFHIAIILAGVFYGWLGILLLYLAFRRLGYPNAWLPLLIILGATNLYYYSIDSGGMSHVYSFAAFSALIYAGVRSIKQPASWVLIPVLAALIVMIRPLNAVLVPFVLGIIFFLNPGESRSLLRRLLKPLPLLLSILVFAVFLTPQMVYWQWAFDSPIVYSYGSESFENLLSPKVIQVLFSTNNGLLLYNPVWLILILSAVSLVASRTHNERKVGLFALAGFVVITYLIASWWIWSFGCGYGHRCYVELTAPFALVLLVVLRHLSRRKLVTLGIVSVLLIGLNMKMIYTFDECWLQGDWDYLQFLKNPVLPKALSQ